MNANQIESFNIVLQKLDNQAVFSPGDVLIGILSFHLTQPSKVKSVRLVLDGSARVKWAEGKGKKKKFFGSVDTYLREKTTLCENDELEFTLNRGEYSFPFKFNLPYNLPSSFEYDNARIRYSLNATIELPAPGVNKHATRAFTVINQFDLNKLPRLKHRASTNVTEAVKCWGPFSGGNILGELTVNKTGFVPGETIVCEASVLNRSRRTAKPMSVSLVQQIFCHGRRFTSQIKQIDRDVATARYARPVRARTHVEWPDVRLLVPPVCPSTSPAESRAIEIFYALVLRVQTDNMRACKEITIPIVIGTKPILASTADAASSSAPPELAHIVLYQPSVFDTAHSELLPDEYDDNMKGEIVQSNSKSFRPFYPYYGTLTI